MASGVERILLRFYQLIDTSIHTWLIKMLTNEHAKYSVQNSRLLPCEILELCAIQNCLLNSYSIPEFELNLN